MNKIPKLPALINHNNDYSLYFAIPFGKSRTYESSSVINGKFEIFGENGIFDWLVIGTRIVFDTQPLKKDYILNGNGPYTFLQKK